MANNALDISAADIVAGAPCEGCGVGPAAAPLLMSLADCAAVRMGAPPCWGVPTLTAGAGARPCRTCDPMACAWCPGCATG